MGDEVLAAVTEVGRRVGAFEEKVDEKLSEIGRTTGILQIDVAVLKEQSQVSRDLIHETRRTALKAIGAMIIAVLSALTTIGATIASFFKTDTGGQ